MDHSHKDTNYFQHNEKKVSTHILRPTMLSLPPPRCDHDALSPPFCYRHFYSISTVLLQYITEEVPLMYR